MGKIDGSVQEFGSNRVLAISLFTPVDDTVSGNKNVDFTCFLRLNDAGKV